MFRCPTSEFPICPAGKPTAPPDASSVVHGQWRKSSSKRGARASAMALYSRSARQPKPSRTMRMTNGRSLTKRTLSNWYARCDSEGHEKERLGSSWSFRCRRFGFDVRAPRCGHGLRREVARGGRGSDHDGRTARGGVAAREREVRRPGGAQRRRHHHHQRHGDAHTAAKAVAAINTLGFARVANLVKAESLDDEGIRREAERQLRRRARSTAARSRSAASAG